MNQTLRAIYRDGTFIPRDPCDLPEEAEVELLVQGPLVLPPIITNFEEKARLLEQITQRMQQNPIKAGFPRFTREELHERN